MPELAKKFDLQENGKALQIFLYTIQNGPVTIEVPEDIQMFLAYDDAGALNALQKNYGPLPPGMRKSIRKRAQLPVQQILNALALPVEGQEIKVEQAPASTKEHTEREFTYGMMLVADRFVDNPRDRASIKRIMNKILQRYERNNSTATTK